MQPHTSAGARSRFIEAGTAGRRCGLHERRWERRWGPGTAALSPIGACSSVQCEARCGMVVSLGLALTWPAHMAGRACSAGCIWCRLGAAGGCPKCPAAARHSCQHTASGGQHTSGYRAAFPPCNSAPEQPQLHAPADWTVHACKFLPSSPAQHVRRPSAQGVCLQGDCTSQVARAGFQFRQCRRGQARVHACAWGPQVCAHALVKSQRRLRRTLCNPAEHVSASSCMLGSGEARYVTWISWGQRKVCICWRRLRSSQDAEGWLAGCEARAYACR